MRSRATSAVGESDGCWGTARALKRAGIPVRSSHASTSWPMAATRPVAESGAGRRFHTDRRASWSAPRASSRAFSTEDFGTPLRPSIEQRVGGLQLQHDAGQLLRERVVDLPREAGALLEHRVVGERLHRQVHPPGQQRCRDEREHHQQDRAPAAR